jgi:hypothetical protein
MVANVTRRTSVDDGISLCKKEALWLLKCYAIWYVVLDYASSALLNALRSSLEKERRGGEEEFELGI